VGTSRFQGSEAEWNALVETAFHLDERLEKLPEGRLRQQVVRQALESVLEVFPAALDPVERFPAYAVRRMLLAVIKGLEESKG